MITFTANGRCASCATDGPITSGSVGIPVVFIFNTEWDGLSKVAVFRGGGLSVDVALFEDNCVVPAETLAEAGGVLRIGVYGRNSEGTVVIPTVWAEAGQIRAGATPSGVNPAEPTPDWTAQVQAAAAEALNTASRAEEKIDQAIEQTEETRHTAVEAAENAAKDAAAAALSADRAEQAAADSGYMFFEIDERGHAIYKRTANVDVDFEIINGRLLLYA